MTPSDTTVVLLPGLVSLRDRLRGGVMPAFSRVRPVDWPSDDASALVAPDLWKLIDSTTNLRTSRGLGRAAVEDKIRQVSRYLICHRPTLLAVLFSPDKVLDRLTIHLADDEPDVLDVWFVAGWIAEAAWRAIDREQGAIVYGPIDQQLLQPVAARLRFLVLTEPWRHRGRREDTWSSVDPDAGDDGLAGRIFGTGSTHLIIGRCREARRIWHQCVTEYQSHPLLAGSTPREFERELSTLLFRNLHWPRTGSALVLSFSSKHRQTEVTAEDTSVIGEAIERHLLPRFRLWLVARLASGGAGRWLRYVAYSFAFLVVTTDLAAAGLVYSHHFGRAATAAATCYGLLGIGVIVFGRTWATQWLLRLPAASAVGLFVLLTLPTDWWQGPATSARPFATGGAAITALVVASYGYLVIEARNHGVGAMASIGRALVVAIVAAMHALLVCLIGLVFVAPAYTEHAGVLAAQLSGGHATAAMAILVRAVAWCLTVGVFSQILWDDRPITAPLAHLQWRQGR